MRKNKKNKVFVKIIITVLIVSLVVFLPIIYLFSGYLSETKRVKANILLVEGWLPDYALELAYDEFQKNGYDYIITTGLKFSSNYYYMLSMDGYLIFYPEKKLTDIAGDTHHIIEVNAYSELDGVNSAHFNVFVNNSPVADFFANKSKNKFPIPWRGSLNDIDSIVVQFTNDGVGDYGDRNLFVKEIIIDKKTKIPYLNNSVYVIGTLDSKRRVINNFNSYAEFAKNRILAMGMDSSLIIAIQGEKTRINRTLSSALAFRDWLKTSDIDIEGINIVTMGTHARRTLMTYDKILKKKYNIGIISLPDYKNKITIKKEVLQTLREALGIIYYWFILIPY